MICSSVFEKIIPEQLEQQHGLTAPADAGDYLDFTIVHVADDLMQIEIPFDHRYTSNLPHKCSNFQI